MTWNKFAEFGENAPKPGKLNESAKNKNDRDKVKKPGSSFGSVRPVVFQGGNRKGGDNTENDHGQEWNDYVGDK